MYSLLATEKIIKTPYKGHPYFSINHQYLAFSEENHIRIKNFETQEIKIQQNSHYFILCKTRNLLCTVNNQNHLQIYNITNIQGQIKVELMKKIEGVRTFIESKQGLIIISTLSSFHFLNYIRMQGKNPLKLQTLPCLWSIKNPKNPLPLLLASLTNNIFLLKSNIIELYKINEMGQAQKIKQENNTDGKPIAIYKDRYLIIEYVLNNSKIKIEIYDMKLERTKNQFMLDGVLKYTSIQQNMLLLISTYKDDDYYCFCILNSDQLKEKQYSSLITYRKIYMKKKAQCYAYLNRFHKTKNIAQNNQTFDKISLTTSSEIFVLSQKNKRVQIISLKHKQLMKQQNIQKQQYKQNIQQSKLILSDIKKQQKQVRNQLEQNRIKSSINYKSLQKPLEQVQKQFIQEIIKIQMKLFTTKLEKLQIRVNDLENHIHKISVKIQDQLIQVKKKQIKENMQELFDKMTLKFEKYFNEVFTQVSDVLKQGVSFYQTKLANDLNNHKQILEKIMNDSIKMTTQLSKNRKQMFEKKEANSEKNTDKNQKKQEKKQQRPKFIQRNDISRVPPKEQKILEKEQKNT